MSLTKSILLGVGFGGIVGIGFLAAIRALALYENNLAPKQIIFRKDVSQGEYGEDLNSDGINDLVIKLNNGHKIPMYGIRENSFFPPKEYVSGETMEKISVGSRVDYDSIEARLNE